MNWKDLENVIQRTLQPLKNRISLMVGRCLIAAIDDSGDLQAAQISLLADESMDNVPHFQNYGFGSNPPVGSEGIVVALQGNREQLIIIGSEHRATRVKNLEPGESVQYNAFGSKATMTKDSNYEMIGIKKLKFANDSHELIQVLDDLVTAIINARTNTAIGPMPLMNPADPFTDIKTRLETFKS